MSIEPKTFDPDKPRQVGRTKLPVSRLLAKQVEHYHYMPQKLALANICGIRDCIMDGGFHGTPMCEEHAWQVWATLNAVKEYDDEREAAWKDFNEYEAHQMQQERWKAKDLSSTWKGERWIEPGWVYYLQVGDRIKIGYSKQVEQRMKQYPPHSTLLATHPGTPKIEREMHHKFLHLLANGREWFTVTDELMAHIEKVRQDFKQGHTAA